MTISWRDTLQTLLPQFEALAARSTGLHHLFVEAADNERDKLSGPSWFSRSFDDVKVVDGKPVIEKWGCCGFGTLPTINPTFREPNAGEIFDESMRVIRDGSGIVRAVPVTMRLRQGYYCGEPTVTVDAFKSLANAAAAGLAGANNLNEHFFASDLTDLFRKPRGGVRYLFGDVPETPNQFMASGWDAGVVQYENGVLIDMPISESSPSDGQWLILLHRLGWRRIVGSPLIAQRFAWNENIEVALEMLRDDSASDANGLASLYEHVSSDSFYSVIGTKESPLNLSLASVFAIQLLLEDLRPTNSNLPRDKEFLADYSKEEWYLTSLPDVHGVSEAYCKEGMYKPDIGILVATEVEKQAVLKTMRPLSEEEAVLSIHIENNTYYLGRFGAVIAVLCMSSMGSTGRDASLVVTTETIETWALSAVVMVGIAFGKDAGKQEIGNVLVSDRIIAYEPQRVGKKDNQNRGHQPPAGSVLLNRCRNVLGWKFQAPDGRLCGFQVGPILSGEKLIDNLKFKAKRFDEFPTAIGGEMEGAGVAAAADRKKCEWIIIKSICDWGDGKKTGAHQEFAAAVAVSFVEHVLNQPGALDTLNQ